MLERRKLPCARGRWAHSVSHSGGWGMPLQCWLREFEGHSRLYWPDPYGQQLNLFGARWELCTLWGCWEAWHVWLGGARQHR